MSDQPHNALDLNEVKRRLETGDGAEYWRSLGELADTPEFRSFAADEFPAQARPLRGAELDRRTFLSLAGASMALAGLTGCRMIPQPKVVPYVQQPENLVPGKPLFYASNYPNNGYSEGVLVTSHMGRPTKIEGNPEHPSSLGSTSIYSQASILNMYDPDRSRNVLHKGEISTYEQFIGEMRRTLGGMLKDGSGLRLLTETVTSPSLASEIEQLLKQFPGSRWHSYQSVNRDSVHSGTKMVFGQPLHPVYDFTKVKVVVTLDGDFPVALPGSVRYARDFSTARKVSHEKHEICRVYSVESAPGHIGSLSDHRLPVKPTQVLSVALALAAALGVPVSAPASVPGAEFIRAAAEDLKSASGDCLVVAGDHQPAEVHAVVHAINSALGAVGRTVQYIQPVEVSAANQLESLKELQADMANGTVKAIVILGGNPVYTAPADLRFGDMLDRVPLKVRLGAYVDETSLHCDWHIPESTYLEAWGDLRAYDGTVGIVQPLIEPLYDSRSALELVAALRGRPLPGYDLVKEYWKSSGQIAGDFEKSFQKVLHDGHMPNTAAKAVPVTANTSALGTVQPVQSSDIEIVILPDPGAFDGQFANNAWMLELPRPFSKLVWDNAAFIGIDTAAKLKANHGDVVELVARGLKVEAPVFVQPGQPEGVIALHLGLGRTSAGSKGNGVGFDAGRIRHSEAMSIVPGVQVKVLGKTHQLVTTQEHHSMEGRDIVRTITLEEYKKPHENHAEHDQSEHSIFPHADHKNWDGEQWAMTIDLTACIGCNTCVIACQSENNIPTVGKEEVQRGREMHWIRIDRYYKTSNKSADNPQTVFQPVMCMHCEAAPCEPVCPVAATVHSAEGLNQMAYNRCVGTRYCSNNCPYKVRRFNFLNYANHHDVPVLKLLPNPDVTVRGRGVMEKCSYCVQRINAARIESKKSGRPMADGDVVTACQAACPTQAITFGNKADARSAVSKARADKRNYALLAELNTSPRTTYNAKVIHPNPALKGEYESLGASEGQAHGE
jgi:molybdopterin-containing oxidoreductase family iron-sulfur binding subunit